MGKLKIGKHEARTVNLKDADVSVKGIRRHITYPQEECCKIAASLIDAVWRIEKKEGVKHCPDCGRIVPELAVKLGGRLYRFMCYEIADALTGRVFAKIDFKKSCRQ